MADEKKVFDDVEKPAHYNQGNVETIDALEAMAGLRGIADHCKCCVVKYLWRGQHKGDELKDAKKALWYLKRFIATLEKIKGVDPSPPA